MVPRLSDVYAALPSLTGKFELEYEGELVGAERVARDLIREAVGEIFSTYLGSVNFRPVVALLRERGKPALCRRRLRPRRSWPSSGACPSSWSTRTAWG